MNAVDIKRAFARISTRIAEKEDYLISLDQQNGDGDLGLSMRGGFAAVCTALEASGETDLGRLLLLASRTFNENAPSSLGTILSFGLMGMARALKGETEADTALLAGAMEMGLVLIMDKAGSRPGEKTILDALCPAVAALRDTGDLRQAAEAAAAGSESTRAMRAVHGRAAYYGDKSLGVLDGGSAVGRLIFEALAQGEAI